MTNTTAAGRDPAILLGVDLGGTTAKLGLFRSRTENAPARVLRPELLARMSIPTRTEDEGRLVIPDIAEAAQTLAAKAGLSLSDIDGIGIGVPGPVLEKNEKGFPVVGCVNLGWTETRYLDAQLRELTGIEHIYVCNDANAAGLGELYFGGSPQDAADASAESAAQTASSAVMVTLGTGVGGGVIREGRVVTGAFGAAGEIGHMPMRLAHPFLQQLSEKNPDLRADGDLEYYASATGVARIATAALRTFDKKSALQELGEDSLLRRFDECELEARHVFDAAKDGDKLALAVTDFFFDILGQGLATIASVMDPELFIIGGGVAAAGEFLLDGVRSSYRRQVFHASRGTAFRLATLGNDAGLLGPLVPLL